ncbi:MAG: hypothetical protein NUK62_00920 [Tenericutes bacterium]|nr:hypothetical protein [Mycoplasmatota bacterium]
MTHELMKKKVQAEIDVTNNPGDQMIYNFVRYELLNDDEAAADEFMLSDHGGYTIGQLRAIKFRSNYYQMKNKQQSFVPGRAF